MSFRYRSKYLAEMIGTFTLVFAGCGSIMVGQIHSLHPLTTPLVFGLAVASMIYALGHISGAHFNPAVTLAFSVVRHFPKKQVIPYLLFQFLGGLLALTLLWTLLPGPTTFGETLPSVEPWRAFFWEVILTFILMFVIISVATDTRAVGMMAGAAIGGTVTLCALFAGPLSGASMNPARSLAPNLFAGAWDSLWIYLSAPFLGAVISALTYESLRCDTFSKTDTNEEPHHPAQGCC